MCYALAFSDTFYWGEDRRHRPNPRPTSVLQALISLPTERRADLARNVFVDPAGDYTLLVYDG